MIIADISLPASIIMIAGGISLLALIIAKICLLGRKEDRETNKYECGFRGTISESFKYVSEKRFALSVYLLLELAVAWLMICYAYHIAEGAWSKVHFIKILSIVILMSILISVKAMFTRSHK